MDTFVQNQVEVPPDVSWVSACIVVFQSLIFPFRNSFPQSEAYCMYSITLTFPTRNSSFLQSQAYCMPYTREENSGSLW